MLYVCRSFVCPISKYYLVSYISDMCITPGGATFITTRLKPKKKEGSIGQVFI